jgi:nucleoside-diphosphate-sugar epimerase
MRVFVVGGTGFIGPFVVARLANLGHHVAVYHRGSHEARLPYGVEHIHSPLAEPPIVAFPPVATSLAWDVVLAMAPLGAADARALMDAFRGVARRVVALSSGDVYRAYGIFCRLEEGPAEAGPLSEDAPLRTVLYPYRNASSLPDHLRDYEKLEVERAVTGDSDLRGTVLRLPAVFGPGDWQHRFGGILESIESSGAVTLGESYAQWRCTHGYVEDVAQAVVLAVLHERARGKTYNVGEDPTPTVAERAAAFARAAGGSGEVVVRPDAEAPAPVKGCFEQDIVYDTTRIRRELDWSETVPSDEAWRRTVEWERASRTTSKVEEST